MRRALGSVSLVGGAVESRSEVAGGRRTFGRMLSDALKSRGMKQDDLARALGTTQSSVSGWVNGKYEPGAATVFSVERTLGLEPGFLSRPLGYLPVEPVARPISVEAAIAMSTTLDDDAKAAMTSLFRVLADRSSADTVPARPGRPVRRSTPRERLSGSPAPSGRAHSVASGQ